MANDQKLVRSEVCATQALWVVLYRDQPFTLSVQRTLMDELQRYQSMVYTNSAHTYRLAENLNKKFHCQDFTVKKIEI
jgi:hypothetical protein